MKDIHFLVIFDGDKIKYVPDFYTITLFKKVELSDINVENNVENNAPQHSAKCYNTNRGLSRIRGD